MASALSQMLGSADAERLPLILAAVLALIATIIVPALFKNDPLSRIPFVGAEMGGSSKRRASYMTGAKHLYWDGYQKFKNGVCRITTARKSEVIIVAPEFLPELKKLPDDVLSMAAAVGESLESRYTKIETDNPLVAHTIKSTLTPNLVRLNPILAEEVEKTVSAEMPPCKDWTKVNVNSKLLRIVAIISGRIFVGPELCHDEAYIDAAINYTVELVGAMMAIKEIPPWRKSLEAPFLRQVKKLEQRTEEALRLIKPIVAARRAAAGDPAWRKPDDMLQWMMDSMDDEAKLTNGQLGLTFAAIHTTTLTSTNAFYNLAAEPELVAELREEIRSVLKQHDGKFTSAALQGMKKMDSVLKETLRLHPPSFASFERKVLRPFTLSNGQLIPAGVTIEVPAYGTTRDPSVFSEPEKFDGLRFYRLRDQAETFNKHGGGGKGKSASVEAAAHNQFVSVSQNSLTFGYGRHACPGRFFAANEIKMIMARMILHYDIQNVDGSTVRYPNFEISNTSIPDTSRELLFKEIAAEA